LLINCFVNFARRANLANCGFMVNMQRADASFGVRRQHASCVRNTAEESLVRARFFSPELAKQCVDRVFDRCYRDEGFSRILLSLFFFFVFMHMIE
jgi:hypothetical protein